MTSERPHQQVDAVLLMGGNIRGNVDEYPEGSFFSLETLQQETKSDEVLAVVSMPGWLLSEGVQFTHSGEPIPGWIQYDDGVQQDEENRVTHVAGKPLEANRIYRVATKVSDLTNGQCPQWTKYYTHFPQVLPPKGAYFNIQSELMSYFAQTLWRRLWDHMTDELSETLEDGEDILCPIDSCPVERLDMLDNAGAGSLTVEDIQQALRDRLGLSVDDRETTLAEMVHDFADMTGNGEVTLDDFEYYCDEMSDSLLRGWINSYDVANDAFDKVKGEIFKQAATSSINTAQQTSKAP
eukprot:CAMPEP_0172467304 /NCGR_PEP_ID=MMETSP1065-20121228/58494_1 /TAXON_ID=265537 /ORGANISM="Amphiprora paludosa, Strain CCMP125" /LENGTH=294 /DNA_ID=CAMNT_0013224409 /DNA_START=73 /DNA_END=957 /DNA_ORIENTATION=+